MEKKAYKNWEFKYNNIFIVFQVKLAEILGADPQAARAQLKDSLMFEIQIANVSKLFVVTILF